MSHPIDEVFSRLSELGFDYHSARSVSLKLNKNQRLVHVAIDRLDGSFIGSHKMFPQDKDLRVLMKEAQKALDSVR